MEQIIKAGVDLDGVKFNLIDPFDSLMEFSGRPTILPSSFGLGTRYQDTTEQEGWDFLTHFIDEKRAFRDIPFYPKAKEATARLKQAAQETHIITARLFGPQAIQDTYDKLREECHLIPEQIFIENQKGLMAKILGITHFFEDSLENAYDIIQQAGSQILLINQPYNQIPKSQQDHPNITRYDSYAEAVDSIIP